MDGYSFMVERNRRLIEHERALRSRPRRSELMDPASFLPDSLREDLRQLYDRLEGCGGVTSGGRSDDHQ